MNIAIIGTRGIPNRYGGFEQFAEKFSKSLVSCGHSVTVYNSHRHPYRNKDWKGIAIVHCKDLEPFIGPTGQFIYDLNCILHSRTQGFDVILQLGYTSSTIWGWLLPRKKSVIITNMDGLEWMRSKYSNSTKKFLLYAERLGVKYSDYLVADSLAIRDYLKKKYHKNSTYIAYGATAVMDCSDEILNKYGLVKYQYNMLLARLEPENNIEMILDGNIAASNQEAFLVIGNCQTKYGEYLKKKYSQHAFINFINSIYDIDELNSLRYYSNIYFHGHSVGGTNPSLIEAMASGALICAHDNIFNKIILGDDGYYFSNSEEVAGFIDVIKKEDATEKLLNNVHKIEEEYSWKYITDRYIMLFEKALTEKKKNPLSPTNGNQRSNIYIQSKKEYPFSAK
ncbi:DUF1972 domain-containing protein [Arachidicoccus sp.]|uniref:DUF1972 domain-containing protein n=1 Tax=Arachidicoccus sp. TaxID=1872624 RepID=UPI003D212DC4